MTQRNIVDIAAAHTISRSARKPGVAVLRGVICIVLIVALKNTIMIAARNMPKRSKMSDYTKHSKKLVDTSALVKEAKAYNAQHNPTCGLRTVEPTKHVDEFHAGVRTHICNNPIGHDGNCRCACGHLWKGMK